MKIGEATYCNVICAFAGAEAMLHFMLTPPYKHIDNQVVICNNAAYNNILALPLGI